MEKCHMMVALALSNVNQELQRGQEITLNYPGNLQNAEQTLTYVQTKNDNITKSLTRYESSLAKEKFEVQMYEKLVNETERVIKTTMEKPTT
eukprot:UN07919